MSPVTIRTVLDGKYLGIPELAAFAGKEVEIVVREPVDEEPLETRETMFGLVREDGPTMIREEALRLMDDPRYQRFRPFLESVGTDFLDVDAIIALRASSPI